MATSIPLCATAGRASRALRHAAGTLADDEATQDAAQMLDLLVRRTSEHTAAFALRLLRARLGDRDDPEPTPAPAPSDATGGVAVSAPTPCPCEMSFRHAAEQLRRRGDAQDEVAARVLDLTADVTTETNLAVALDLLAVQPPARRAA